MQKQFIKLLSFFILLSFLIGCTGDSTTDSQTNQAKIEKKNIPSESTNTDAKIEAAEKEVAAKKKISEEEKAAKLKAEEEALAIERAKIEEELKAEEEAAALAKKKAAKAKEKAKAERKRKEREKKKREEARRKKAEEARVAIMTFNETSYQYGIIDEGEKVEHTFYFTNTGDKDLNIIDVKSSCGCTHPTYPFIPIKPGDKGEIGVIFNSNGKWGAQKPTITLTTDAKIKTHKLYLVGRVRPKMKD